MLLSIVHGDGIFEHECKNQLNGEQSKSNVCTHRYREVFGLQAEKNGVKVKPKLHKQDEAFPDYTHTNSFLGELCFKYTLHEDFFFFFK